MQSPAVLLGDHHAPQAVDAPDDAGCFHITVLLDFPLDYIEIISVLRYNIIFQYSIFQAKPRKSSNQDLIF
jgi:hypothetical protein